MTFKDRLAPFAHPSPHGLPAQNMVVTGSPVRRQPLSGTYSDEQNNKIRLWLDPKHGMVAGVLSPGGKLRIVPGNHIRNGLSPQQNGDALLSRLLATSKRDWKLVQHPQTGDIHVWPAMAAEGSTDYYRFVRDGLNPFGGNDGELKRAERQLAAMPPWDSNCVAGPTSEVDRPGAVNESDASPTCFPVIRRCPRAWS